jgi:beta-glucuronidase
MKFFKALLVLSGIFCFYSFAAAQPADKYLMSVLAAAEKHNNTMTFEKPEKFSVHNTGIEKWVDYDKYGEFSGLGTENYKYIVKDLEGLQAASGAGIYPNTQDILNEPDYKDFSKKLSPSIFLFEKSMAY